MLKFKVGDTVKITSGKDKGREGKIELVFPKESLAVIPGINTYKKHVKGGGGQKGGIYELPRPLSFAKFSLVCPKCKRLTRVGFRAVDREKVRICRKCGKEIDAK
ncbi:MAG: 50S ribosomal protein L24 [Patescibacteria group bacterium]